MTGQEHDPAGDVWARHADGPHRDRAADRATVAAIEQEQAGEYDADGQYRPSTWGPA